MLGPDDSIQKTLLILGDQEGKWAGAQSPPPPRLQAAYHPLALVYFSSRKIRKVGMKSLGNDTYIT